MTAVLLRLCLLLCLAPCNCFLDFQWHWTEQTTPVDIRGQMIWFDECMSGPVYYPLYGGCLGRFDLDDDGHVDLLEYSRLQIMIG